MTPAPSILSRLRSVVGPKGYSEDAAEIAPHLQEWRGRYQGHTPLLLKPATTAEVSAVLALCHEAGTPIVPQGGNTGLVGGQIPLNGEILLSLQRMNRIREIDTGNMSLIAEAGTVLDTIHKAANDVQCIFPLSLASEGSCTIGGNLSTNAGGVDVLRYGTARDLVLGLEVVLADGRVLNMLRTLRKDNTGYDLKHLFIGAEGTLGIITAAVLKLFPKPVERVTVFAAIPSPKAAVDVLLHLQNATGGLVCAFELVPRIGLNFVLAHIPNTADPFRVPSPWYVLMEATSGTQFGLRNIIEQTLSNCEGIVTDAVFAESETQRAQLWRLRESLSEAQKPEGGSIKHDISVPIARIPEFIDKASETVDKLIPGARMVPFGHIGDGNVHFNVSMPVGADCRSFLARREEISHAVHDIVHQFGGSISAEHGLGTAKRNEIARYKSTAEIDVMRVLKHALDPKNILNPGKLLPD